MNKKKNFGLGSIKYLLLIFLAFLTIFGFKKHTQVMAKVEKNVCYTREEFSLALSQKQKIIYVNDVNFGDSAISIEINYSCQIIGKNTKSIFSNAHFVISGGTTIENAINVTFDSIIFDGMFATSEIDFAESKSFSEYFGSTRTNPNCRAITLTGLSNLNLNNCEFKNYVGFEGAALYRLVQENTVAANTSLKINNCKFFGNVCEDGVIYLCDKSLIVNIINCELFDNYAQIGSGLSVWGSKAKLSKVNIHNNTFVDFQSTKYKYGGAIFAGMCEIEVDNSIIKDSKSFNGGGVALVNTNAVFKNCLILNNKAISSGKDNNPNCMYLKGGYGGGIFVISNEGQNVKFLDCNISNNSALNGGAIAIMPASANFKGGAIQLLFSNVGLNTSEDNISFDYYAYESRESNIGVLNVKGCFVVEDYEMNKFKDDENYNCIYNKMNALSSGIINEEIIQNIDTNGIKFIEKSKAEISVPYKVFKTWDKLLENEHKNRLIGINDVDQEVENKVDLTWLYIVLGLFLAIVITTCAYLIVKHNNAKKEPVLEEKMQIADENLSDKERINSNVELTENLRDNSITKTYTDDGIDKIIKNLDLKTPLTKKELEVFKLVLKNKNRKAIAQCLFVTEHTVKKHLANIYVKFDVKGKNELKQKVKEYI